MTSWGNWRLNPTKYDLEYHTSGGIVARTIDLLTCTQSSQVLDWIMHESSGGACESHASDLVRAFNDLLHPRATMCSFGSDTAITVEDIKALVDEFASGKREWGKPGVVVSKIQARPLVRSLSPFARLCQVLVDRRRAMMRESARVGRVRRR